MATNNRGRNNNNPEGYNQHSGFMAGARERPVATAAAAAAAVGAGVFLWSRRNQISDQLSSLSEQVGEWTSNMRQGQESRQFEMADGGSEMTSGSSSATGSTTGSSAMGRTSKSSTAGRARKSPGMSETGSGNASLGASSGGGGMSTAPSGRGRA